MASAYAISVPPQIAEPTNIHAPKAPSIKAFAEAIGQAAALPSNYNSLVDPRDKDEVDDSLAALIPVIDFSLLTSKDPEIHAKAVHDLGKACTEWGFFLIVNHGMSDNLMKDVIEATRNFFELPDEEKQEFSDTSAASPLRYGSSFNVQAESVHFWRDYLKAFTHPQFSIPNKPAGFRGMSESLGLEANAIADAFGFDTDFQFYIANLYPPCPQPELALGQPPHSDNTAITLLIENGIGGLQVYQRGKWVKVKPIPGSIMVNIGDQLELVTNGKYNGVLHRVTLNNNVTRVSLALAHGPSFDKFVCPIPEIVKDGKLEFKGMNYGEYFYNQQSTQLVGKSRLDLLRISS
ncbi:putative 2-oxoglutarate and Fe(II)-dependent oxygenase superfamily protein [Quillaja saponaria]|uniref:2-oxoglutarate and Fe(II)-dependent oxygenase superfamily protein n=1 Tax=Quillaja saponaria TaxID=32244 RepID=A0AAD7PHY5_QUISA|nr:putative 2-oxoglutarate and Fe(II)-dependent oxygenase superfamily protein [Quillaja saponaria]